MLKFLDLPTDQRRYDRTYHSWEDEKEEEKEEEEEEEEEGGGVRLGKFAGQHPSRPLPPQHLYRNNMENSLPLIHLTALGKNLFLSTS